MQLRTNPIASLLLAFTGTTLAVVACGGSSSSSKDTSNASTSTSTSGAGGTGDGGVTDAGGPSGTSSASSTAVSTNASTTTAGDASGSGGTNTAGGTGGSTATTSGGTGGTSGAAGEAASSDSGGTAGSGGAGPTGVIGVLGEPCDSPGQLACAGNHQKLTVVCGGDGEWEANETCTGDQFCDTEAGGNAGSCQDAIPECVGLNPGARYCAGNTLMECGADTVSANELEECTGVCEQNACNNARDACPEGDVVNCASDCGGPSEDCLAGCPPAAPFSGALSPLTVRLPGHGDLCEATCDASVRGIFVQVSALEGDRVRITVPSPWLMSVSHESFSVDAPCDPSAVSECMILEGTNQTDYVYISTAEVSAQPRNAVLEYVDEEATCP